MSLSLTFGLFVLGAAVAAAALLALVLWLALVLLRTLRATPLAPGSVVLITGSSRGLGLAIASRLARGSGIRLVLNSRHLDELEQARATLLARHPHLTADDILLVPADLSQRSDCERLVAEALARFGRLDVLVNNAGIIEVGPAELQPIEAFERALSINFMAACYTSWAALPHLLQQAPLAGRRRAAIVNIASIGGKLAVPHLLPYTAAKFALVGFSEGLHAELARHRILVTTVCPGLMRTGGEDHAHFLGNVAAERRWFMFAAKTPGIAVSVDYAARCVVRALTHNRAEVCITPQATLAARCAGLAPETTQLANALTNRFLLPKSPTEL